MEVIQITGCNEWQRGDKSKRQRHGRKRIRLCKRAIKFNNPVLIILWKRDTLISPAGMKGRWNCLFFINSRPNFWHSVTKWFGLTPIVTLIYRLFCMLPGKLVSEGVGLWCLLVSVWEALSVCVSTVTGWCGTKSIFTSTLWRTRCPSAPSHYSHMNPH